MRYNKLRRLSKSHYYLSFKKYIKETNISIFETFLNPTFLFLYIEVFECKNNILLNKTNFRQKLVIDKLKAGTFISFSQTDITINYTDTNQSIWVNPYS